MHLFLLTFVAASFFPYFDNWIHLIFAILSCDQLSSFGPRGAASGPRTQSLLPKLLNYHHHHFLSPADRPDYTHWKKR